MLDIVANYHCMQFQGKLMNQTSENVQKLSFGPDFDPFGTNSGCQIFFVQKSGSVSQWISWSAITCTILEKTNDPILKKLSDRQTD